MKKQWHKVKYHSNWHSYYSLDDKPLVDNEKVDILIGQTSYKTKIKVKRCWHQGLGGMDESYSWDEVSVLLNIDGSSLEVKIQNNMKLRRR